MVGDRDVFRERIVVGGNILAVEDIVQGDILLLEAIYG